MKTYEIRVTASTTVIVKADDEEGALEVASDACSSVSGFEIDDWEIEGELTTPELAARAIEYSTWHSYNGEKQPIE